MKKSQLEKLKEEYKRLSDKKEKVDDEIAKLANRKLNYFLKRNEFEKAKRFLGDHYRGIETYNRILQFNKIIWKEKDFKKEPKESHLVKLFEIAGKK